MQAISTELEQPLAAGAGDARVAGLTILYHPSLSRVGERALLTGLEAGRSFELSRLELPFAAPGARDSRPLADPGISRAPLQIRGASDGSVTIECGDSRSAVEADGRPIAGSARFTRAELERGVVLLLGRRIVLLLHLLDPVTDAGEPSFGIVGYSAAIVRVRGEIRKVADFDIPVLVCGESGTGKELVARAIHDAGARRDRPFLAVNLGAVPQALAASEMFGAVRGAFTGASQDRPGYFQRAQGGTIFLDEIGEAAPELQVLLLRALESREIQPVGAERPRPIDVRVVSATDADLQAAIEAARFRAPLLYRLSGYVIRLPPLRARREDFGRLLAAFLRRELAAIGEASALDDERRPWLPAPIVGRLAQHGWPGNVRQLANVVRHLVIANRGLRPAAHFQVLDELWAGAGGERAAAAGAAMAPEARADLPEAIAPPPIEAPPSSIEAPPSSIEAPPPSTAAPPMAEALPPSTAAPPMAEATPTAEDPPTAEATPTAALRPADITDEQLVAALRMNRFSPERAAAALGIPRASIYRLMDRSTRVRKASSLSADEIRAAAALANGDEEAMAERLEVSVRALRRRMGELALRS